jgi:cellobiose transport system permease protein
MSVTARDGADAAALGPRRRLRPTLLRRLEPKVSPYVYIAPFFVLFALFGLFPLVYTGYVSLTDRNLLSPVANFIGLHNYALLIHDSYFWNAVENTFGIWFLSTVPQLMLALVIAHVLNTKMQVRSFFRMAVLLPQVTSLVAVALIFTQMFGHDYGFVNYLLGLVGIHHVYWEAGRFSSWLALSVMVTWRWTGFNALIYLAAMQSIPEDLYEAAAVDGANAWTKFLRITLPLLSPVIFFNLVLQMIHAFQTFTQSYVVSAGSGGPVDSTLLYTLYIYQQAFTNFHMGYASALAWLLMLVIGLLTALAFGTSQRWVHYAGEK